jgi:hypothetical protein
MRIAATLIALAALATPASAQIPGPGLGMGPALGQLKVEAYQKIPRTKTAVQLTSDTALARNLRREVMVRLARRGNEVGFSGGNVMRMDVTYFDLLGGGGGGGLSGGASGLPGGPSYASPGDNPRMDLPRNKLERRDTLQPPPPGPTLRITLTLYAVDTGKVIWAATASCIAQGSNAEQAGIAMIDNIFQDADKNRIADAGCPL